MPWNMSKKRILEILDSDLTDDLHGLSARVEYLSDKELVTLNGIIQGWSGEMGRAMSTRVLRKSLEEQVNRGSGA